MLLFHGSNVTVKYPTHQIVFCTENALATLEFEGSYSL